MTVVDSNGQVCQLGPAVTRKGGEGQLFGLIGETNIALKLFSKPPNEIKERKLLYQIRQNDAALRSLTAWPLDLVYQKNRKEIAGFKLDLIKGSELHMLYIPRSREKTFPGAGWDFMVHVAKNICRGFKALHTNAVLMGDVNEGNILVKADGTTAFIDCDSYQINTGSNILECGVGIPIWTAPELQGKNFRGLIRDENSELFSLALLIFKILFLGRHPFAGIQPPNVELELSESIAKGIFPYSRAKNSYGISQPRYTLGLDKLPSDLQDMFEVAFSLRKGRIPIRPKAQEWELALDRLSKTLTTEKAKKGHVYFKENPICPWCQIENSGGPNYFFSATVHTNSQNTLQKIKKNLTEFDKIKLSELKINLNSLNTKNYPVQQPSPFKAEDPCLPPIKKPVKPNRPKYPNAGIKKPKYPPKPVLDKSFNSFSLGQCPVKSKLDFFTLGTIISASFFIICTLLNAKYLAYFNLSLFPVFGIGYARTYSKFQNNYNYRPILFQIIINSLKIGNAKIYNSEVNRYNEQCRIIYSDFLRRLKAYNYSRKEQWKSIAKQYANDLKQYQVTYNRWCDLRTEYNKLAQIWNTEYKRRLSQLNILISKKKKYENQHKHLVDNYKVEISRVEKLIKQEQSKADNSIHQEIKDLKSFKKNGKRYCLVEYLKQNLIEEQAFKSIGKAHRKKLKDAGILSANDIGNGVSLYGFGSVRNQELLNWKKSIVTKFRYNPNSRIAEDAKNSVGQKYESLRISCLNNIISLIQQLKSHISQTKNSFKRSVSDYETLQLRIPKAEADMMNVKEYPIIMD
jgi:DNA-binding helix-hairpin-helix protein with protein kinase domain